MLLPLSLEQVTLTEMCGSYIHTAGTYVFRLSLLSGSTVLGNQNSLRDYFPNQSYSIFLQLSCTARCFVVFNFFFFFQFCVFVNAVYIIKKQLVKVLSIKYGICPCETGIVKPADTNEIIQIQKTCEFGYSINRMATHNLFSSSSEFKDIYQDHINSVCSNSNK